MRCVYTIITTEIPGIEPDLALQMAFKALNDSVGPNDLVSTLLVFGAYPRITDMDASSPTITQRPVAMRKAMEEVQKSVATRQIFDALNTRNGLSTTILHDLPLNSLVLVFCEGNTTQSGSWKGPYKLLSLQGKSAVVELTSGPTKFRTTSVKPYYLDPKTGGTNDVENTLEPLPLSPKIVPQDEHNPFNKLISNEHASTTTELAITPLVKCGRGRPRKHPVHVNFISDICFLMDSLDSSLKSLDVDNDSLNLPQFTTSRQKEITGRLEKRVFMLVNQGDIPANTRIFNSQFVDEIKNVGTDKAFEKSRLVVQAYNDLNKDLVLTQSPTI